VDYWHRQLERPWGTPPAENEEPEQESEMSRSTDGQGGRQRPPAQPPPTRHPQSSPAPPARPSPPAQPAPPPWKPAWQSPTPPPPTPRQPRPTPPQPGWQATRPQPAWQGPSYDYGDGGDERAARITAILAGVGLAALVLGLVVFFTVRTLRTGGSGRPAVESAPPLTTPEDAARVVGGLGPPQGTDVVTYATTRKQALAGATGDRVAVVSLNTYTTEAKAKALAGQAQVVGLLAAAPGGAPALVTGSMRDWVNSQTADARAERDEIQRLIPTAQNDPAFQRFYREEVERLNRLLNAIKPDGNLVFGLVIRAPVPTLQQLGTTGEVRLVDVGPEGATGSASYRGFRPEETSRANEPNTRPLS